MGFFGMLGKVLTGRPVYTPQGQSAQPSSVQPVSRSVQTAGKVVPMVRFGRIECQAIHIVAGSLQPASFFPPVGVVEID